MKTQGRLPIPADALQRGNRVFVKGEKPEGDGRSGEDGRSREAGESEESGRQRETGEPGGDGRLREDGEALASGRTADAEQRGNVPDGFYAVRVETGLISEDFVEILSGDLKEGDEVYVSQTTVTQNQNQQFVPGMGGMGGMGGRGGFPF